MSSRGFANWAVKVFAGDTPIVKMAVDGCFNLADQRAASKAKHAAQKAELDAFERDLEDRLQKIRVEKGLGDHGVKPLVTAQMVAVGEGEYCESDDIEDFEDLDDEEEPGNRSNQIFKQIRTALDDNQTSADDFRRTVDEAFDAMQPSYSKADGLWTAQVPWEQSDLITSEDREQAVFRRGDAIAAFAAEKIQQNVHEAGQLKNYLVGLSKTPAGMNRIEEMFPGEEGKAALLELAGTPAGRSKIRALFGIQLAVHQSQQPIAAQPTLAVASDVKYCSTCGTAAHPGGRFCGKCGMNYGTSQMQVVSTPIQSNVNLRHPESATAFVSSPSPVRSRSLFRKVFIGLAIAAAALIALMVGLVVLAIFIPSKSPTSASASTEVPSIPVATSPAVTSTVGDTADVQPESIAAPASVETPWSTYLGDSAQYGLDGVAANEGWFKLRKVGVLEYALKLGRMHGQNFLTFNTEPAAAKLTDNVLTFVEPTSACRWTITFVESKATVIASSECNTVGEALSGSYSRN
jgi:hypothetical protein